MTTNHYLTQTTNELMQDNVTRKLSRRPEICVFWGYILFLKEDLLCSKDGRNKKHVSRHATLPSDYISNTYRLLQKNDPAGFPKTEVTWPFRWAFASSKKFPILVWPQEWLFGIQSWALLRVGWTQRLKINMVHLKITQLKRNIIFQTAVIGFHVNFPGCRLLDDVLHGSSFRFGHQTLAARSDVTKWRFEEAAGCLWKSDWYRSEKN